MIIEGNKHHLFFMNTSVGGLSGIAKTWKSFFISTDIGLFLRYSSTKKRFSNSSEVLFLPIFESGFLPELNLNLGFKLFYSKCSTTPKTLYLSFFCYHW